MRNMFSGWISTIRPSPTVRKVFLVLCRANRPNAVIKAEQYLATVKYLSNFEEAINKLVANYLYNQPQMHEMVKDWSIVHRNSNFAKCLTVFVHHNLSSANATDPEDCTLLEQSLRLFPYLKSKSEFESMYRSYLEKRLLSVNAFWLSKENFVISYMSVEHDVLYSKQLEKMINDVQVESVKLCDKFVSSTSSLNLQFDLRLNVLNHLAWDKFTQNDDLHLPHKCNQCFPNVANYLPKSFESVVQKFRKFYLKQYQEPRKLSFCMKQSWAVVEFGVIEEEAPKQHRIQPGSSELKTTTNEPKQVKVNLITSAPQLMILMCITESNSNKTSMTFAELKQKFANILTTEELTRALKLLTHFQVLHKKSTNKDEKGGRLFHDQDVLVFDPRPVAPANQRSLTNITTMKLGSSIEVIAGHFVGIDNAEKVTKSANETKPVSELSKAELDKHHSVCVQAALVRITKKHRQIRYQSLVEEVQSELHTRYNRTGVQLEFIDAQAKAVINLGTITAQPEQLDTDKRDNLISY